jgi:hypothetical protein
LKKDGNGFFRYFDFSKHWVDSLITYAKLGICPDFIRYAHRAVHLVR